MNKREKEFIFGFHPLMEAIDAGKEVEKILFKTGLKGELYRELFEKVNLLKIPFQFVPAEKLNSITRKNHQGVIGFISLIEYQKIETIIPTVFENGENPFILLLDKVTDVRNFGAIARTAECAGVHAIVIPLKNAARINADAIKTSAGALYNLNVCRVNSFKNTLEYLKDSGLQVVAVTEKTEQSYYNLDFTLPTALLFGSEDEGISAENLKYADKQARIPLHGSTESLNVSNAAAIMMYEVVRQRL